MEDFKVDLSKPTAEFRAHLDIEGNRRIIFSGPFGIGKTYFLKHFFEENEDKYTVIRLAPVNYVVAQNEDIFELIKFDILFHLLQDSLFPKKIGLSKEHILNHLSLLDPQKGLIGIFEKANQVGADVITLLQKAESLLKRENAPETHTNSESGIKELAKFIKKISLESGGIYEHNIISQLLYFLIDKIADNNKQRILLIDDLDRIDPEHIFRILNVFAAHFDLDGNKNENKFGFDRVILVCDLYNVRSVFSSRYGQSADFSGYIDKFYSRDVFCFDNTSAIIKTISDVISTIKVTLASGEDGDSFLQLEQDSLLRQFIVYVLTGLLHVNSINLRSILKLRNKTYVIEEKALVFGFSSGKFPIFRALELLRVFLGDGLSLKHGIQKCINQKVGIDFIDKNDENNSLKASLLGPVLLIPNKMNYKSPYIASDGNSYVLHIDKNQILWNKEYYGEVTLLSDSDPSGIHPFINIFPLLLDAVEIAQRNGLLK